MKKDEIDNGMTVADMSGVDGSFLSSIRNMRPSPDQGETSVPKEKMTFSQSFWFILGAMKAGLMIAAAYGVVYFIVLLLMTMLWR